MHLRYFFYIAQSQAKAFYIMDVAALLAVKFIKYHFYCRIVDADAFIADGNDKVFACIGSSY